MRKTKQENIPQRVKKTPVCQVCLTDDPEQKVRPTRPKQQQQERKRALENISCISCKSLVHKFCYDPSLHEVRGWKCDFCKHSKGKSTKQECFICKCEGKVLKHIEDNKFAHVHCAISSDMVILQNFKTLKFRLNPDYKAKDISRQISSMREKSKDKQSSTAQRCSYCKKDSTQGLFKCFHQDCTFSAHIYCLLHKKYFEKSNDDDIIFNLLSQTIGSFRVKNGQFLKKESQAFRGINMIERPRKNIPIITCTAHSSQIKWCSMCYRKDPDLEMNYCCRCYIWTHTQCAKMKNKSQNAYFECDACINNYLYLQRALFPQQICRLVKIQTSPNKWSKDDIRYLDTFAFKSSTEILNLILTKNKQQFEHYQLYRYLEKDYLCSFENREKLGTKKQGQKQKERKIEPVQKILQRITAKDLKQFNNKKIIEVLYFLKYKEFKSRTELNTPAQINDLRDAYQFPQSRNKSNSTIAAEQQKCKKILDKLLDLYIKGLKQTQMKDITMKVVQFSDKLRREIVNIKEQGIVGMDNSRRGRKNQLSVVEMLRKRPYEIALALRQLLKMIAMSKDKLKTKFEVDSSVNFLMMLFKCTLSSQNQAIDVQDLLDLINSYRKIIYTSHMSTKTPQRKLTLSQQQFYKITNKSYDLTKTRLTQENKVNISKFFNTLIKQRNIKQPSQLKTELTEKYDQLVQQDRLNYKQSMVMRENIAEQGLFIDKHSKLINLQKRTTYYRVLKIKYMKIISLELANQNNNSSFSLKASEKNRKDILDNVRRLLQANNKSIKLTEVEKDKLEYFLVREEVFTNILREEVVLGAKLQAYNPRKQNSSSKIQLQGEQIEKQNESEQAQHKQSQSKNVQKQQLTILQRIRRIFSYWINHTLDSPYQIIKILYPIAQKRIKFPLQYQAAFNDLIQSIGTRYDLLFKCQDQSFLATSHRVTSDQFMKLWKLIEYAELENAYDKLKTLSEEYNDWLTDLENRYNPIAKVLEDKFLNSELLQVIDRKISEAERFQIDLKSEVKKLKIVKLWCVLSDKFQKDFQRKPTINAVQQFKNLMIKVKYPHNEIHYKVLELQSYGRHLNQRIDKYLKKPKQEELEFYEEVCLISSKMSLKEAEQLKNQLQNSKLDVNAQLQTLQDQISNFIEIPAKIQPLLRKQGNFDQLIKIKGKIMESPIKYESMDGYCQLVRRIGYLKCQNLQGNINKKQFFRLLNTSDTGAVILTQKMPMLLKAYRDLQKAEKEVLNTKPKQQSMLPIDGRSIKEQLAKDPTTLHQVQRIYEKVNSLRQRFRALKNSRESFEKYFMLEYELSHHPVCYQDITTQIHRMKRELDILVDKSMMLKKSNLFITNIDFNPRDASEIVRQYSKLGMRHPEMEEIRKIYEAYSVCMALSERQDDYMEFSQKCREYPALQSIISLNETRSQLFGQYSEEILQQKAEAENDSDGLLSLLQALIHQGSYLLKHVVYPSKTNNAIRTKTLETLLKINKKINDQMKVQSGVKSKRSRKQDNGEDVNDQWGDEYISEEFDEDGSGGFEEGYDDQDDQEADEFEEEDEDDQNQYDEYGEEESIPQPPKKRAQPLVMEISDQDNEPQPQPRKVAHIAAQAQALPYKPSQSQIVLESQEQLK